MLNRVLDEKSRHHINTILDSGPNRMGTLVDDLLAYRSIGRNRNAEPTVDLSRILKGRHWRVRAGHTGAEGCLAYWRLAEMLRRDPAMLRLVFYESRLECAEIYSNT